MTDLHELNVDLIIERLLEGRAFTDGTMAAVLSMWCVHTCLASTRSKTKQASSAGREGNQDALPESTRNFPIAAHFVGVEGAHQDMR